MEIVNVKSNYDVLPVNAILSDDTIIPGINGRKVDVDDSFNNMRSGGVFREEELVFNELSPSDSLVNNKDKYIVKGNGSKKEVALLMIYDKKYDDSIDKIDNITIFINHNNLNISNIGKLKNNEIYTYGNNGLYNEEILLNDNTIINRLSNNNSIYCLTKEKKEEVIKLCSNKDMYTILPNIIGGYYEIKNRLSNGSIILLDNLNDIDIIIKYIQSKGYKIVSLSNLISE